MESLIHHHRTVLSIFMKNSIGKALFVAKTELPALQAGGELVPLTCIFLERLFQSLHLVFILLVKALLENYKNIMFVVSCKRKHFFWNSADQWRNAWGMCACICMCVCVFLTGKGAWCVLVQL